MSNELKPCPAIEGDLLGHGKTIRELCDACPNRAPVSLEALAKRFDALVNEYDSTGSLYARLAAEMVRSYEEELNR